MARFANPLFGDVSRQLEIFGQNRLRAPLLEGQLRGSLAQARRQNALAGLDEQTFGSNAAVRDKVIAGPGDNVSAFLRGVAGSTLGGSNAASIRSLPATLAALFGIPDTAKMEGQGAFDQFLNATVRRFQDTSTGQDKIRSERAARASRGGGRPGGTLSASGRAFVVREIKRMLEDAGAEGFEGADNLALDAIDAVTSRISAGMPENDALTEVLRKIDITKKDNNPPGSVFSPFLRSYIDPTTFADRNAYEPTIDSVSLGDQLGDALTGDQTGDPPDPKAGVNFDPRPERPAVLPDTPSQNDEGLIQMSSTLLAESLDAIARGEDPSEIARFLREHGIDPSPIFAQETPFSFGVQP